MPTKREVYNQKQMIEYVLGGLDQANHRLSHVMYTAAKDVVTKDQFDMMEKVLFSINECRLVLRDTIEEKSTQ